MSSYIPCLRLEKATSSVVSMAWLGNRRGASTKVDGDRRCSAAASAFVRVCAESVTEKPKHLHLRGSVKLISAIMIARIVSLYFAIPRRISLYVPARLMGKSIAQVSTKFFCSWGCTQLDAACSWHWPAACSSSVAAKNAPQAPECVVVQQSEHVRFSWASSVLGGRT